MEDDLHFFGEWVYWDNEEEKEQAILYLRLWKKFQLKRLNDMEQVGDDQIILRTEIQDYSLKGFMPNLSRPTLGIKIAMKGKITEDPIMVHKNKDLLK